jgi:hypothetical protein
MKGKPMRLNNQFIVALGLIVLGYIAIKSATQRVNDSQQKARKLRRKKEIQTWEGEGGNVATPSSPTAS